MFVYSIEYNKSEKNKKANMSNQERKDLFQIYDDDLQMLMTERDLWLEIIK